jgi:Beta-lactamase enzyme family
MSSSTYPGPYRATTTAWRPPGAHTRVTTARDLGRALYRLHAGAHGDARVLRLLGMTRTQAVAALRVLASAQPVGQNAGLLQPWLGSATLAQKNGWLSDTRTTAAIVYRRGRATIVVVEAFRPGITYVEAKRLGRDVLAVAGLN